MDFITDRTQTDVSAKNSKAYVNLSDFQRVEDAIKLVSDFLGLSYAYKEWELTDVPNISNAYQKIYDALTLIQPKMPVTSLVFPVRPFNTFQKWNELESYLQAVYDVIYRTKQTNIYSGEFYAGERW